MTNPDQETVNLASAAATGGPFTLRPFGFNVIGTISANIGLGVSARQIISLLLDRAYPISVFDLDAGWGRSGHDLTFAQYATTSREQLPYAINLSVLSIVSLPDLIVRSPPIAPNSHHLDVGLIWWELPSVPKLWADVLGLFDVILAPSRFIQSTLQSTVTDVPTIYAIHPLFLPSGIQPARARFNLPEDKVLFVTIFEPTSDIRRKNPFAAIQAFQDLQASDMRAHLVIKANNSNVPNAGHRDVETLKALCAGHPRIHLIDRTLSYPDVLSLYASCDVFVSLHRSEGLGLGIMEAMILGKPVIATAWSGNMTYMNGNNSCLVGYKLVPVEGGIPVYTQRFLGPDAMWAEPNLHEATIWMKKLTDDVHLRARIGARAAQDMRHYNDNAKRADFGEELRAIWDHHGLSLKNLGVKQHKLQALRECIYVETISPTRRMARKLHRSLDRHLLWRFRG